MDIEKILSGLNTDQRAAVLHNHEKDAQLLILAGAGSGKTSVLTKRIQYRIAQGVAPEKILALTFTAKAASEMRERVQKIFPNAGVRLCTFHSLALFMLRQKIADKYAYETLGFKKSPVPHESLEVDFYKELSNNKIPLGKVNRENLFSDVYSATLKSKLEWIRKKIKESGKVVFEDLIYLAIRLLETSEQAKNYFQEQWTEILVDEYQDINPSQYRLVKNLLGERNALFVVGDDDQAIYGFRGADIGNINRFCLDFKKSSLIRLEWNYRSTPNILHLANEIFKNKPLRLQKILRAGNENGSNGNLLFKENRKPEVWNSENPVEEITKVIYKIKELRRDYDLGWKNFAILVRYNRQRLYFEEALKNAELPVFGTALDEDEYLENGIHVETVHASKGLQYAVVFYAGLAEGLTPGSCEGNFKERKKQLEEERRLYYVGVTRAEAYLVLLYCKKRYWKGKLLNLKPSRFLPQDKSKKVWTMPVILFKIYVLFMVGCFMLIHIFILPFILISKRNEFRVWLDKKIQVFSLFCMKILRVDLKIEGQAKLAKVDWTRPVFAMGNHNSFADIPIAFLALERTVGFIAKKELQMIPVLRFWMKEVGCIFVDRKKGGGAKLIREAMASERVPRIFIFPEGTRGKDETLSTFKSGGFRLAQEGEAIIVPIVIKGASAAWEYRKNTERCEICVKILDSIDTKKLIQETDSFDPRKDLMPMVRTAMEEAL